MVAIDLKQVDLEQTLNKKHINLKEKKQIKKEIKYYDEYYLTNSRKLIKVLQQEFIKDSYMKLDHMPKIRLVFYTIKTDLDELENIFRKDDVPIITRVTKHFTLPNFDDIPNRYGKKRTVMIPKRIKISKVTSPDSSYIHPMSSEDITEVENLFKNEYSLRYRLVKMMYEDHPEACFVYKKEGSILGVTFNKIEVNKNIFYMRQIFVRDGYRLKNIGISLYQKRLAFARQHGLRFADLNIRIEASLFHDKFNPKRIGDNAYYVGRSLKWKD